MATLEITIDDVGAQGDGIAHQNNATIFVGGALKGERVRIDLPDTANVVKRGELLEVLIPSSQRNQPPCPHFHKCGGCRFQHMNDSAYSEFKINQLLEILLRERLSLPPMLPPVVTAAQTRRRARVAVKHTNDGVLVGFNEWRSREIVNVTACEVVIPSIVTMIDKLRAYLPMWLPRGESCDVQITALHDGIDIVLIGGPRLDVNARQNMGALAERLGVAHLSWRKWDRSPIEPIAHRTPLSVKFGKTRLAFPPASFLQATAAGEAALIDFVCSAEQPGQRVLDLFSGLGTFGLSLEAPKSVHFCDLDGPAMGALQGVAKQNSRYSTSIRNLNTDPFSSGECNDYDLVIFDPPRGGAKAQAREIAKSDVKCVVGISCDPVSFAHDAQTLINGGYEIQKLLPVDQFLWSSHIELAALFLK